MESTQPPILPGHKKPHRGVLEPHFKMAFLSLIAFTGLAPLVYLAVICTGVSRTGCPQEVKDFLNICIFTWKVGFGAVVTLTVGKVLNILQLAKVFGG